MKIYGIDLGTTNSMIGLGDTIISEMVPSIASMETGKAGESLREDYNATRSFKINMSMGVEGNLSVSASALVLKELVRQAKEKDHDVKSTVITVPAYFSDNQRQATIKAAKSIGLDVKGLLNEPTAAAMVYSKNQMSLIVVYDLGGGTFDVSIIDSRFGNFDVQATEGLTIGGDNLDKALQKHVLKAAKFKIHKMSASDMSHLKDKCEKAKIAIHKTKQAVTIDLREFSNATTVEEYVLEIPVYVDIMKIVFGPTITKLKQVIAESIQYGDTFKLVLVGGSTHDPFLQEWIANTIGQDPEPLTYNPDKIVAEGACLYASLLESGEAEFVVSDVTKTLGVILNDGTVQVIIPKNSKIPISNSKMMTNSSESYGLELELCQGDSIIASNNEFIGKMRYEFGELKRPNESNVKVTVEVDHNGIITLRAKELLKPEQTITIDRTGV